MEASSSLKAMKGFFRLLKSHQDHAATSIIEAPSLQTLVQTSSPLDFVWSNFTNDELEVRRTQDQHAWCKSNVSARCRATNPVQPYSQESTKSPINARPLQLALETLHGTPPEQATTGSMLV